MLAMHMMTQDDTFCILHASHEYLPQDFILSPNPFGLFAT